MAQPCAFCDRLNAQQRADAWRAYGEDKDAKAAVAAVESMGLPAVIVNEQIVVRHFTYHGQVQPPPAQQLDHATAVGNVLAQPALRRHLLDLIVRHRALAVEQAIELIWSPRSSSQKSARAAAYREIRPLVQQNLVFKIRPPEGQASAHLPGARPRRRMMLLAGRDLAAWAAREGLGIYVVTQPQEIDWHGLREAHDRMQDLVWIHKGLGSDGLVSLAGGRHQGLLSLDARGSFGRQWISDFRWKDNLTRVPYKLDLDALAVFRLQVLSGADMLLPLLLMHDDGWVPIEQTIERIKALPSFMRSRLLAARWPDLKGSAPPVLVVAYSPQRAAAIQNALAQYEMAPAHVVMTDRLTLANMQVETTTFRVLGKSSAQTVTLTSLLVSANSAWRKQTGGLAGELQLRFVAGGDKPQILAQTSPT